MKFKLFEQESYEYIYIGKDRSGREEVQVLVPVTGGRKVGVDNTCQTAKEIKQFFVGSRTKKNILQVIDQYIDDLTHDIVFLENNGYLKSEIDRKKKRLIQLRAHKSLLSQIVTPQLISSLSSSYPYLPAPILSAMSAEDSNCFGFRFCPSILDDFLRLDNPLFSINRMDPTVFKDNFNSTLKPLFLQKINSLQDQRSRIIAELNSVTKAMAMAMAIKRNKKLVIKSDKELDKLKELIIKICSDFGITIDPIVFKTDSRNNALNFDYFKDNLSIDAESPVEEWIINLMNFVDNSAFKEKSVFRDRNSSIESFYIKLQLLLAVINAHHNRLTGERKNFGQILETHPHIMHKFIAAVSQGIESQFEIEAAIFDFSNKHFYQELLTPAMRENIVKDFTLVWTTIEDSPHFDEFLYINERYADDRPADFYVHKSRISLTLARYTRELSTQLFDEYFQNGPLQPTLTLDATYTGQLRSKNSDVIQALIEEEQVIALDVKSLSKLLVAVTDNNQKLFQQLSTTAISRLKERADWPFIFWAVMRSAADQETINQFSAVFNAPSCYVLSLSALDCIYTQFSLACHEDPVSNVLNDLSGVEKMKKALDVLEIRYKNIEFNNSGDFLITFDESVAFDAMTNKLVKIEQDNKSILHITSHMAPVFYQLTEALTTGENIANHLKALNNHVFDTRSCKMAYALRQLLHIRSENIVSAHDVPGAGQIKIQYYHRNGFVVEGDPSLIDNLRQSYNQRLNRILNELEIEEIVEKAGLSVNAIDQKSTILNALMQLRVSYYGLRKIGTNWIVSLEGETDKKVIESICEQSIIARRKKHKEKVQLRQFADQIAKQFDLKVISVSEGVRVRFKSYADKWTFVRLVKKLNTNSVTELLIHSHELVLNPNFVRKPDLNKLRMLWCDHPHMQQEILDHAGFLSKILGGKLQQQQATFLYNIDHSKPLHVEVVQYFLRNYPNECELVQKNDQTLLQINGVLFLEIDVRQTLKIITHHLEAQKTFLRTASVQHISTSELNYKVLLSKSTLNKIISYRDELRNNQKKPGGYLAKRLALLNLSILDLDVEAFIDALFQTKIPCIFAESELVGHSIDWNSEEIEILGELSVAVPTEIYDDGRHSSPKIHAEPINGQLIFTPGALLKNTRGYVTPDRAAVVMDGRINEEALFRLYETRLLPVLFYINQTMNEKQTRDAKPKAFITVPGIGCGQFAAEFSGHLGEVLKNVLIRILNDHGRNLPHIKALYFDPYNESKNERQLVHHIHFLCRPLQRDNASKSQLNLPSHYEETVGEFSDCELFSLVAWDHFSWITNDLIRGLRQTDDGAKGAASKVLTLITGYPGKYDATLPQPVYLPEGYSTWYECILNEGLTFQAKNHLFVLHEYHLEKLRSDGRFTQHYHFPLAYIQTFKEHILEGGDLQALLQPGTFKLFLNQRNCPAAAVVPCGSNGVVVSLYKEDMVTFAKSHDLPYQLTPEIAMILYREVIRKDHAQQIANLNNNDGMVVGNKIRTTCKMLDINVLYLDYHRNEKLETTHNGYDVIIPLSSLIILNDIRSKFYRDELPLLKSTIIDTLNRFNATNNPRISELIQVVRRTNHLLTLISLLENQIAIAAGSQTSSISNQICNPKWTTTTDHLPTNRIKYHADMTEMLNLCQSPAVENTLALIE